MKGRREALAVMLLGVGAAFRSDLMSAQASEPTPSGTEVSLQVDRLSADLAERRPLRPGEVIHAGETIALRVRVSRDAYVYAVQVAPSGDILRIFPRVDSREHDILVHANLEVSMPSQGGITLDEELGEENIIVVATPRPLAEVFPPQARSLIAPGPPAAERLLDSAARRFMASDSAPPPPPETPRPPPEPLRPGDRNPPGQSATAPSILRGQSGPDGVAGVRFRFHHIGKDKDLDKTNKRKG